MPRTFRAKGMDMIPAPIILVETLNTAPETDAVFMEGFAAGRRGTCSGAGDMTAAKTMIR